jgi:hypothetical protein
MKFHIHDWDKWSDPVDTAFDGIKVQARRCVICNRAVVRRIRQPFNIWFTAKAIIDAMKDSAPQGGE